MHRRHHVVRNARLLLQSGFQHLVDDPTLLVVQISRRMPVAARMRTGQALSALGRLIPRADGLAALGAFMAGRPGDAETLTAEPAGRSSPLRAEVAVLLGRGELVTDDAPATTRARAAWARGAFTEAVAILDRAGRGRTRYAERLRSELRLLEPGHRLTLPARQHLRPEPPPAGEPLRVLHLLTNSLPHTQSGYSLRSHRILGALREKGLHSMALTRTGYPVMVGKIAAADVDDVDGISYVRTLPSHLGATPEERLRQEAEKALTIVETLRPHVLHTTTDYRNALVARAVSEATGIPWVLEVRGLMEQTWIASHGSAEARQEAAASEKASVVAAREAELASAAHGVVTLSSTMADELEARGVDRSAITMVPNGVGTTLLKEGLTPPQARAQLGLGLGGAFVVGAVSALVEYEGHEILLRAVAHLIDDRSVPVGLRERLHVVIAGDGTAAPGLAALARELGIEERVTMPGRVPREQAATWVHALDAVVVPRLDREVARMVTPQKPVEAMALSRPVILSDLAALREIATDDDGTVCAVTVPPENPPALAGAIAQLHAHPQHAEHLALSGRRLAAGRTWDALAQRYQDLYSHVTRTPEDSRGR